MIIEKGNVFYCDCGFSFERGRSGAHDCGTGLRKKLAESQCEFRAADATNENLKMQVEKLAAELSAVESIHNEAVFITDEHYEQCPPEVQKMIRSLAVLQIPAYQTFLAEVRASGIDAWIESRGDKWNGTTKDAERFAENLRKGVQS